MRAAKKRWLAAAVIAVLLAAGSTTVLLFRSTTRVAVSASSSAAGTRPDELLRRSPDSPSAERPVAWASDSETVGAWLSLDWTRPTRVNRVQLYAAGSGDRAPRSVLLGFDDGSSLLVTAGPEGNAMVTFPERRTSRVRITVAEAAPGAKSIALAALAVDDGGPLVDALPAGELARLDASSGLEPGAGVLQDGDAATSTTGGEWLADAFDPSPWVRARWSRPVEVSSVQVLGPSAAPSGIEQVGPVMLSGVLRFDDGSEVVVSGVESGGSQPTTIGFAPRVVRWARLDLARSAPNADAGLREFQIYGPGTTPPRWSTTSSDYAVDPPAVDCADAGPAGPIPWPQEPLELVCPGPGAAVSGRTTVVVAASPGTVVEAAGPVTPGASAVPTMQLLAEGTAGSNGRAVLTLDTADVPRGPITILLQAEGTGASAAVPLQLFHRGGRMTSSPTFAPRGLTPQWSEEFNGPVSVSATGEGALYAAAKPTASGAESFGEAAFADPASGAGTVATVDGYLRLRAESTAGRTAAAQQGQSSVGGMLSSLRVGAGGFAAQYGYFEARMTGAPGRGSWPAFWTLNTRSATRDNAVVGEADAVELYGHNPAGSCHTIHHYDPTFEGGQRGEGRCLGDNGFSDWTTNWHTYGMRIVPGGALFFIDGVQVADLHGKLGRYDEPFFFMVNLALGGDWPVDLSATAGRTDLYVDWIRVYT
ncbi:glycoside hydrolase family 16 protein [Kineococcus sp. SYSU DK005]|uniref:glycoside hydrolase family 16 protein n=1 Tax=Kineococcus sp. SYSU DK005 TaxID=3383126 RepID=UPI003D7E84C7